MEFCSEGLGVRRRLGSVMPSAGCQLTFFGGKPPRYRVSG